MTIRLANLRDIKYIEHLRRKESEAVGFIPIVRYEMEIKGERGGSIYVCEENHELLGFIYATHNPNGVSHIQQIAVQEDARKIERGKRLVNSIIRKKDWLISCRCAADLESTEFWEAIGFKNLDIVPPKSVYGRGKEKSILPTRRKRKILRFQRIVGGLWLPTT